MKKITSFFASEASVTKKAKLSSEEIKMTASETCVDEYSDNDWPS